MEGKKEMFFRCVGHELRDFSRENKMHRQAGTFVMNKKALFAAAAGYAAALFFLVCQGIRYYEYAGFNASIGDCYVIASMAGKRILMDIPMFLIVTIALVRNKWNIQYLILWKKRTHIWLERVASTACYALLCSIFETALIGIYGMFITGKSLNWEEQGSMFWGAIGKTYGQGELWKVCVTFLTASFLLYTFTGFVVLVGEWLTNSFIPGICLCVGLSVIENLFPFRMIYNRVDLFYEKWLLNRIGTDILFVAAVTFLMMFAGLCAARRKEFYGK